MTMAIDNSGVGVSTHVRNHTHTHKTHLQTFASERGDEDDPLYRWLCGRWKKGLFKMPASRRWKKAITLQRQKSESAGHGHSHGHVHEEEVHQHSQPLPAASVGRSTTSRGHGHKHSHGHGDDAEGAHQHDKSVIAPGTNKPVSRQGWGSNSWE
jgi:hypothetical protein